MDGYIKIAVFVNICPINGCVNVHIQGKDLIFSVNMYSIKEQWKCLILILFAHMHTVIHIVIHAHKCE